MKNEATEQTERTQVGRLAMRVVDDLWCAFYAMPDTMDDAVFLGSIQMAFVQTQERRDAFMQMMQECVGDILEERAGVRPTWQKQDLPEDERKGRR